MKIGIDIMGGDFAPEKTVHGAVLAQKELPEHSTIVLFGIKNKIISELNRYNKTEEDFEIIDCKDVIEMGERPTNAFKSKPNLETYSSVLLSGVGPTLCNKFYFPYARKIWGLEPDKIDGTQSSSN